MNFLSHYYFDRYNTNPEQVIGMVLPDLLKNARKDWNIRPEKNEALYTEENLCDLLGGWKKHIEVDKYFHSSKFFLFHTRQIRILIAPLLEASPARPFFVAHIALELILDSLLLKSRFFNSADFYTHLQRANRASLAKFLNLNAISETEVFFNFLEEFIQAKYLDGYSNPGEIVYAINKICMRLWANPFTEVQKTQLNIVLAAYEENINGGFMLIFDNIERQLITAGFLSSS